MSDRKLSSEGKWKETVQHWSVQRQLYANRSKGSHCEVTKGNKAQGRAITEGSWLWLWKSTSQKTELITLSTSTNGWNQKQIPKHEPYKRSLSHWNIQKRGSTGIDLQQLTLLEKPFQLQSPDFIFPGNKGSSWTLCCQKSKSWWVGPPTMWQFLKILVCWELGKLIKHTEKQQDWIRRVPVGGEEPGGHQLNRSSLYHLEYRLSDVMPTRKQDVRPLRHSINPYEPRKSKIKGRTVSAPLISRKLWILCEWPQGQHFITETSEAEDSNDTSLWVLLWLRDSILQFSISLKPR